MVVRVLELFSGTGSVGDVLKMKYKDVEIISLDIHPKYNPTHTTDILKWNYKQYETNYFDIIWASPPCTEYSVAKTIGVRNLDLADKIVKRTFVIIDYLKPKYWFVENPGERGLLGKRPFMKRYEKYRNECTYCHYGALFRKPTNIWTNVLDLNLRYCTKGDQCKSKRKYGKHPKIAQHSASSTTYYDKDRGEGSGSVDNIYPIPPKLILHIVSKLIL